MGTDAQSDVEEYAGIAMATRLDARGGSRRICNRALAKNHSRPLSANDVSCPPATTK